MNGSHRPEVSGLSDALTSSWHHLWGTRVTPLLSVFVDVPHRVPQQQRPALQRGSHHAGDAVQRCGGALQRARRGRLLPRWDVERLGWVSRHFEACYLEIILLSSHVCILFLSPIRARGWRRGADDGGAAAMGAAEGGGPLPPASPESSRTRVRWERPSVLVCEASEGSSYCRCTRDSFWLVRSPARGQEVFHCMITSKHHDYIIKQATWKETGMIQHVLNYLSDWLQTKQTCIKSGTVKHLWLSDWSETTEYKTMNVPGRWDQQQDQLYSNRGAAVCNHSNDRL